MIPGFVLLRTHPTMQRVFDVVESPMSIIDVVSPKKQAETQAADIQAAEPQYKQDIVDFGDPDSNFESQTIEAEPLSPRQTEKENSKDHRWDCDENTKVIISDVQVQVVATLKVLSSLLFSSLLFSSLLFSRFSSLVSLLSFLFSSVLTSSVLTSSALVSPLLC